MRFKKWISGLFDQNKDAQERMLILLTLVAMSALFVIMIVGIVIGESTEDIVTMGIAFVVFGIIAYVAFHYNKVQLCATIVAALLIFIVMPVTFITGGGINGGSPIWFIFCTVFTCMIITGRRRWFLMGANIIVIIICYFIQYLHPEMITMHDEEMVFQDSLISVILVCTLVCFLIEFEVRILREAYHRSEEQLREIDDLNKSQNSFFSSMSHEIRTPINTIIGLNEMILREDISEEVAEDANNVRSASKMLLHLINDILDMSKIESGKMELAPVNYNIGDMISEIVGMFWMRAKEKGLSFHTDIDPNLPTDLYGDEVRIKQILINILNNAIKYTSEGSVTLSIQFRQGKEKQGIVTFTVTDTGIGIKKESIPYLFTAFKRVDETENRYIEGTGLGLAIVKQLVELMGGNITVNSVYTKGSTFIIDIPQVVVGDSLAGERTYSSEIKGSMSHRSEYVKRFDAPDAKVLVVDDNASNLLVVTKLLRDTKIQIDTADSGAAALEKTISKEYHLIFMDHMMPEMDGIECLHRIKNQVGGMCRASKVVALTANAGSDNKAFYSSEGFDGYLVKPTSGEALENECLRLLPKDLVHLVYSDDKIVEESMSWLNEHERKVEVIISTDSVADISPDLIEKYRIAVIPHKIRTNEGVFTDGVEIESQGLVSYMENGDNVARNVAPSVEEYEAFFAGLLSHAHNIIHVSISKDVNDSGCPMAVEAAEAFDNVTVVDTGHLSSGQGLMALEACRLVREGLSADMIKTTLENERTSFSTSFVVSSLKYMTRAGQVDNWINVISNAILMRPVLRMKKGRIRVGRIFFGSQENSWIHYIDRELRFPQSIDNRLLFVTYVGMSQKDLNLIEKEINKKMKFDRIIFQKASPVIALNCGPGTFGLLYRRK
ncbi:EDD domain protein, DegV family [Lachnospiraceae bacterium]|nr:EDD domain protein, DegV family [Lachnospiraceae bacterium]